MRSPIPSFLRWTVGFAVVATLVVAVSDYWSTTQTQWGSLGSADQDLLVKVRQAGLWEIPMGQLAQQKGSSPRVREVGGFLAAEHTDLDQQVRSVASQLGVMLPNEPSKQQQVWMAEIANKSGPDFDRTFVQRLRVAHGQVLPAIAEVRGSTQNELIRSFAESAAEFVTRHCEYLESTGLVDPAALPKPPVADASAIPPGSVPAAVAVPAEATADDPLVGHEQHVNPVVQSTAVRGGNVYLTTLVYLIGLLAIVGLVLVLGGGRNLRPQPGRHGPRRAVHTPRHLPTRPRHAAHRW